MLQQPEDTRTTKIVPDAGLTVRDGRLTAVTCAACGCRLQAHPTEADAWTHYGVLGGRDAMGHRPACTAFVHDGFGRVAVPA